MLTPALTELELKLRVPADACLRLVRHPSLASAAAQVQRLYTIYFDTAKLDLWRSGLTLRVRRDGAAWTQTMKGGGSAQAGLHTRVELHAPLPGPQPDPARFPPGPWTDRLLAALAGQPLQRVCTMQFTRATRVLHREPGAVIEASLDRGLLRASGSREPLCELELELRAGAPRALYELALELIETVPIAVEQRSKAERGYALHAGAPDAPAKGEAIALLPGMTLGETIHAIVAGVTAHVQANEHGLQRHGDPEYVHQMRVGLRRLRSALSVFRPALDPARAEAIAADVRWLARMLGAARDWDVFMESTYAPARAGFAEHAGLRAFEREFRKRQGVARRRAQRAVASTRYQRLMLEIGAWLHAGQWCDPANAEGVELLARPAADYASGVLETRYARLRKRGRGIGQHSPEELHALRIAAKKLRYAAQFFAHLYDVDRAQRLLARLSELQDTLGALNDAAAAQALVQAVRPAGAPKDIAEARGILMAWSRGQMRLLRREAERAWRAARRCPTFW